MNDESYIQEVAQQIRGLVDPSALPEQGLDELFNSYAVLALAKGEEVTDEDVHNAWSAWASKYSPDSKSLVPFDELSDDVKSEDTRFTTAIRTVAKTIKT